MAWLNNGCPLVINPKGDPKVIENSMESHDLLENDLYFQCQRVFNKLNKKVNNISLSEACSQYAEIFKERSNQQFPFSLCFMLLPICFLKENESKEFRNELIKILQITEPPENECSQLLYFLVLKNENFEKHFDSNGGTEPARKLFLQIHDTKNIEWWLQELLLYSTNINASDFDKKLIDHIAGNDTIDCGNFIQTMILTLFFHLLEINRQSIVEYAKENIHPGDPIEDFIYRLIISKESFIKDIYNASQSSLFSVHFLNIVNKAFVKSKDYQLAVLRYVEFLSFQEQYRPLIPDYLKTICEDKIVAQILQYILPSILKNLPKCVIDQLETFEKEYSLKSIQILRNIDNMNDDEITNFLNDYFLESNQKTKIDIMKAVVDFPNVENQFNDSNNSINKQTFTEKSESNKLDDLKDIDGSVVVGMIESYLDVDNKGKESDFLEQMLFKYIGENGDIPEYGESEK